MDIRVLFAPELWGRAIDYVQSKGDTAVLLGSKKQIPLARSAFQMLEFESLVTKEESSMALEKDQVCENQQLEEFEDSK
ncbi:hypothetical protein Tco_0417802 [Tanacetum coccineum]